MLHDLSRLAIQQQQLLRPFPQFLSINERFKSIGTSRYDSLQVMLYKRLSRGLNFSASYTWSRTFEETRFANPQDSELQRLPAAWDIPNNLQLNGVYELPFGPGKPFGADAPSVVRHLIGGWQIATIGNWRGGQWRNVDSGRYLFGDPTLSQDEQLEITLGGRQQRVFFKGDFNPLAATGVDQAALQQLVPADRSQRTLRPLNADRGDNSLPQVLADGSIRFTSLSDTVNWNPRNFFIGPGAWNVDLSLFKTFEVTESVNVRFTADFFNAFNAPMDPNPNATSGLQDLGIQSNDPRIIQFSLRLNW